jgi:hypothetical protein
MTTPTQSFPLHPSYSIPLQPSLTWEAQPEILNAGKGYTTNLHMNRMAYRGTGWRGKHNGLTEISKG